MTLSLPARWDGELLDEYIRIINAPFEVYDSLRVIGVGSGRCKEDLPEVSIVEAIKYAKKCEKEGVHLNYCLNAPFVDGIEHMRDEFKSVVRVLKELYPSSLTISNVGLMELVHEELPDVPFNISTIAGIDAVDTLKDYLHLPIRKLVVPQVVTRDLSKLEELSTYAEQHDFFVEVLVNETCPAVCTNRMAHYQSVEGTYLEPEANVTQMRIHSNCQHMKLINPGLLLNSVWVRPEELYMLEDVGVDHFKVSCRTKSSDWQKVTADAYANRDFDGNLMQICGITPPGLEIEPHELFYLNNKALGGFFERFRAAEDKKQFCDCEIVRLFRNGDFTINSKYGGEYAVESGRLKLVKKGEYFR